MMERTTPAANTRIKDASRPRACRPAPSGDRLERTLASSRFPLYHGCSANIIRGKRDDFFDVDVRRKRAVTIQMHRLGHHETK